MYEQVFQDIKGVGIATLNDFRSEASGLARQDIRKGMLKVVFSDGRAVGVAAPYATGIALAGRNNLEEVAFTSFQKRFSVDWTGEKARASKVIAVTIDNIASKGFVFLSKGMIASQWERLQVRLSPEIAYDLSKNIGIPVWPWVELEAKGCELITPSGARTFPRISISSFCHKAELMKEFNEYGNPVCLTYTEGKRDVEKAIMAPSYYLDDLREIKRANVKEIPAKFITQTPAAQWTIPDNEIWLMKDATNHNVDPQAIFLPAELPASVADFSAQNSFAPLKVDELDNDKFYDLSAGAKKPGLSDILLQIAFNIQNKEGGDSRFINILPRYKRNSPHQLLICNDLHGAFNLLVKTPVEGGLLNVKNIVQADMRNALNSALCRLERATVAQISLSAGGNPILMVKNDQRAMGAVLHARDLIM